MKGKVENYDQVERFLDNQMEGEELALFQEELMRDKSLGYRVNTVKYAREILNQHSVIQFKQLILEGEAKYTNRQSIKKKLAFTSLFFLFISGVTFFHFYYNIKDRNIKIRNTPTMIVPKVKGGFDQKNLLSTKGKKEGKNGLLNNKLITRKNFYQSKKSSTKRNLNSKKEGNNKNSLNVPPENLEIPQNEITKNSNLPVLPHRIGEVVLIDIKKDSTSVILVPDVCRNKMMQAEINTQATCMGEKNGSITIDHVSGGKTPYKYELNGSLIQSATKFHELMPGNYIVTILDSDGCQKHYEGISIDVQNCKKDYEFNPVAGEVWEIPSELGSGLLTIYDGAGIIYYNKKISTGQNETWLGTAPSGQVLTGYFLYSVHHEDGSITQGSVTIARK